MASGNFYVQCCTPIPQPASTVNPRMEPLSLSRRGIHSMVENSSFPCLGSEDTRETEADRQNMAAYITLTLLLYFITNKQTINYCELFVSATYHYMKVDFHLVKMFSGKLKEDISWDENIGTYHVTLLSSSQMSSFAIPENFLPSRNQPLTM